MADAIKETQNAYRRARAHAEAAWRAYYEAVDAATEEAENRGLRSLGDDPVLLARLKNMRLAAVEADAKAKAAYQAHMEAWREWKRSTKTKVED